MQLTAPAQTAPPRATAREWTGLAVLALPTLLLSMDVSVLYLALPQMSADLGATGTQQLWILDIYSFMLAGLLVTMGTLGDRIGRRRLLLIGATAFAGVSLLAAYSRSPETLIAARALLGVAGATLMPSTMALIRNMFRDPKQMAAAIGAWFACFMGGMTVGPLVGGLMLGHFWWGSAFLLGVPVMVLLLIAGPRLLPEYKAPDAGRLDPLSVVLSLAAILPVIYGLKELARQGWHPLPALAIVAGLAVGVLFVRRQGNLAHPLLDLRLFTNRRFTTALAMMLFGGVVMAGISLMGSIYLQLVVGLTPWAAGLSMIPQNIAMAVGSGLAPALTRKLRPTTVIATGLLLAAAGLAMHILADGGRGMVIAGMTVASLGLSMPMSLLMNVIMSAAPPERAGSAASVSETSGEFGIALGIASLGSVGTAVYAATLVVPDGVPAALAETARGDLAAATAVAAELPPSVGAELLDAARSAFTGGINAVGAIGAAIFLTLAVLAVAVLRRHETAAETTES
ncbi:MFS transporter [Actinorhabdospora filicis]|uniref:MFS transporter n=1 Tax=Actinorhabdospora filicis TaxID=1785913 RepID=A0A9W6W4V1_9ACTN|nr:MFS transporter [Actinorhabdospora filicis]GLZ79672.1 MFS transporter [Actinorhabdospora filicis]